MTSQQRDGVWYRPDGQPYQSQEYASDPTYRAHVEDLTAARAADLADEPELQPSAPSQASSSAELQFFGPPSPA